MTSTENDIQARIEKCAKLDAMIKDLTAERDPIKDSLKHDLGDNYATYVGGPYTAKLSPLKTFNSALANQLYGDTPEATEPKVTAGSIKTYLEKKYADKPKKLEAKLNALYNFGSSISFGVRQ